MFLLKVIILFNIVIFVIHTYFISYKLCLLHIYYLISNEMCFVKWKTVYKIDFLMSF